MLINIDGVSFGYGEHVIVRDVRQSINEGDRIGLIGVNGCGKTTLIKLILRALEPDSGSLTHKSGLTVGYLAQNEGLDSANTVYEEMRSVFADLICAEERMRELEREMSSLTHGGREYRAAAAEYDRLNDYYSAKGGYETEVKIKTVLGGMGFADSRDKTVSNMSGGEKTRLALAKLLLTSPELLILDEPTNHLDLDTMKWLERYLQEYKGAILTVSHDRYFLDSVTRKTWEIENKTVTEYRGNYTKYKQLKQERLEYELKEYEKQQRQVGAMLDYAERNIVRATTSKSAKSRLHRLENMELLDKPYVCDKTPRFSFSRKYDSVKDVLSVDGLKLAIGGRTLVSDVSFEVKRGEKLAIVGANGTGKTTLIKTIVGKHKCESGSIRFGKNVLLSYYDQEIAGLDPDATVLDEFRGKFIDMTLTDARSRLAALLLEKEDVEKKVGVLSGGERAKLRFAEIIAEGGNTLVLDEPTNHIDLATREALERGLGEFGGTLLFVSHDRYFINAVCTAVLELADGKVRRYDGDFDAYTAAKEREAERTEMCAVKARGGEQSADRGKERRRNDAKNRLALRETEKEIFSLEEEEKNIAEALTAVADHIELEQLCRRAEKIKERLTELYGRWEELAETV